MLQAPVSDLPDHDDIRPLQVVGAGPAGIGLVLALCNRIANNQNNSAEQQILDRLRIFEASSRPGGKMARYQINANTSAPDVVQGIKQGNPFFDLRQQYLALPEVQSKLIALSKIGELMVEPLASRIMDFLGERLKCETRVARISIEKTGISSFDDQGHLLARSRSLLFCCGGNDQLMGALEPFADRWEGSEQFLLRTDLEGLPAGKSPIVIIGASHSAFSCAWRLLFDPLFRIFAQGREIIILQRRDQVKLRVTAEFASSRNIDYDPDQDVCPVTGIVFFNAGLRKDAKQLYLDIRDGIEKRVTMVMIKQISDQQALLQKAGLILQATGFAPALPKIEKEGCPIQIGESNHSGELFERGKQQKIEGLFGMGLGFNILPEGRDRGEPSFYGGIHGFQSYPLTIAPPIIDHLVARYQQEAII
ncbi:MAG: hypothetical protein AAF353_07185 [Pseudomonadota bacterium]